MLRTIAVLGFFLLAATSSLAQFTGPSRTTNQITVAEVADARVGSRVTLVGNVIERRWDDYYTFRDETGDITVEIDQRIWRRQPVGVDTQVQISGEVERGLLGRYIDVEQLVVLK